jgi:hypothetical protein
LRRFHDSYIWVWPKASFPNAVFNISNVSIKDFPNLTQNFTQIYCSWKLLILNTIKIARHT